MSSVDQSADQRAADRFREELDRLEERTDEQADSVRVSLRTVSERIGADRDLSDEARERLLDEQQQRAREKMGQLQQTHRDEMATLVRSARHSCFGNAPSDPQLLAGWRDADARAGLLIAAGHDEAQAELQNALENNDRQLAQAIARRAYNRGWKDLSVAAVDRDLLGALAKLEDVAELRDRAARGRRLMRWAVV